MEPEELFRALDAHAAAHTQTYMACATLEARLHAALSHAEAYCADVSANESPLGRAPADAVVGPDDRGGSAELPPLEILQRACMLLLQGKDDLDPWLLLQTTLSQLEEQFESAGMPVGAPQSVLHVGTRRSRCGTTGDLTCANAAAAAAMLDFCETHLLHEPSSASLLGNSANSPDLRLHKRRCLDLQIRLRLGLMALCVQRGGEGDLLLEKDYRVLKKFVQLLGVQLSLQGAKLPLRNSVCTAAQTEIHDIERLDNGGRVGIGAYLSSYSNQTFASAQEYVLLLRNCFGELLPKTTARLARDFEAKINESSHVSGMTSRACRSKSAAGTRDVAAAAPAFSTPTEIAAESATVAAAVSIELASAAPELTAAVTAGKSQRPMATATYVATEPLAAAAAVLSSPAAGDGSSRSQRTGSSEGDHEDSAGRGRALGEAPRIQRQRSIGQQLQKQKEEKLEHEREKQLAHKEQARRRKLAPDSGISKCAQVSATESGALRRPRPLFASQRLYSNCHPSELRGQTRPSAFEFHQDKHERAVDDDNTNASGSGRKDKRSDAIVAYRDLGGSSKEGIEAGAALLCFGGCTERCCCHGSNAIAVGNKCPIILRSDSGGKGTGSETHHGTLWVPLARAVSNVFQAPLAALHEKKKRERETAREAKCAVLQALGRSLSHHVEGSAAADTFACSNSMGERGEGPHICSPRRWSIHRARGEDCTIGEAGITGTASPRIGVSTRSLEENETRGTPMLMSPPLQPMSGAHVFVEETPDRDASSQLAAQCSLPRISRVEETPSQGNGIAVRSSNSSLNHHVGSGCISSRLCRWRQHQPLLLLQLNKHDTQLP